MKNRNIMTQLAQIGNRLDSTGAISFPVYYSAAFAHPELGKSTGFDYSRSGNPTRAVLEDCIAQLEKGCRGFAFSSGMAAITTVLSLFKHGDHLIMTEDPYGGTYRLLNKIFREFGISVSYVDTSQTELIKNSITPDTKAIFCETPTNPLMKVADIRSICNLAKLHNIITIFDNTFLTPYYQRPLELGADIVLHSATKYIGGHNDVVAGLVAVKEEKLAERVGFLQNALGTILGPQDSWLLVRGLKTLGLRLDRQQQNALQIAHWLEKHPLVEKVYYPGLPNHPGHTTHRSQASGFGAIVSFTVKDKSYVPTILKNVKIISFAESLGGVESLITYPFVQTHADIPENIREQLGVDKRLLRISVGIENVLDLIDDLSQAFECE
ncbi:PLP-dependent aspartate aminotransferase family protein [Bacillota bacterium LX-D]|nr:PLP-dependent aspartate aminotransferase family protein [Bacillota bacterium LX-D]